MFSGLSLWIVLAMAGVTTAPRDQHACAYTCLFVFPSPRGGAELGHVCGMAAVFHRCLCLYQCPEADLKVLWTEGHDNLGVGVT
jgi:hypothetical protein